MEKLPEKAKREGVGLPVLAYKPKTFVLICQGLGNTNFGNNGIKTKLTQNVSM
jgi:hypothetical protein